MKLPAIADKVIERPGEYKELTARKATHFIPSPLESSFWQDLYEKMRAHVIFDSPVRSDDSYVSEHFGYFGFRWHPVEGVPRYFHVGLDFHAPVRTPVFPITDGILEYSGYGLHSGNYVLLSHPDLVTEDGYTLYSSSMHLRTTSVKFTQYQKMLREISLGTYPEITVLRDEEIGTLGSSGMSSDLFPHLHLQLEFRKDDHDLIMIDPAPLLGYRSNNNTTGEVYSKDDFVKVFREYEDDLSAWRELWDL